MTRPKPQYTCDVCRLESPGWHTIETDDPTVPPRIVRCPQYLATVQQQNAQQLAADAHTEAFKAAKQIIADAAETMPEFSGNTIRERFEDAQIPTPVIGAAFSWARREGLIEATGRRVPSTESTTRHRIDVWRSLRYGRRAS